MTKDPLGERSDPNLYRFVGNSPNNFVDPLGLLTLYGGLGASIYSHDAGNATISGGAMLYSSDNMLFNKDYSRWYQYGSEKGKVGCTETTEGAGVGVGPVIGFFTGSTKGAFEGPSTNLTIDALFVAITFSENNSGWGFSASLGAKGYGAGYFMNTTTTRVK